MLRQSGDSGNGCGRREPPASRLSLLASRLSPLASLHPLSPATVTKRFSRSGCLIVARIVVDKLSEPLPTYVDI
jgi:hypothetical protein